MKGLKASADERKEEKISPLPLRPHFKWRWIFRRIEAKTWPEETWSTKRLIDILWPIFYQFYVNAILSIEIIDSSNDITYAAHILIQKYR